MDDKKMSAKVVRYQAISELTDIINFKGSTLIKGEDGLYRAMNSDMFAKIVYGKYPGILKQQINELEHKFRTTSEDFTDRARYIAMGDKVWDAQTLEFCNYDSEKAVYATRYQPISNTKKPWQYVMDLASGNEPLAWDILQGLAPLFMEKKPAGVIWFIGNGANGKSSLINAMYRIIGHHFTSMTVSAIEDGRDTPRLNGVMGNVCRESSESKIEDSERYKAIGTHEPFYVHKFHSQDQITVTGDVHHVFNANTIPVFGDKTKGARRRTLIVPFRNTFKDNPTFEDDTFTEEFLCGLLQLVLDATHIIRDNRYQYRFSEETAGAKADYDADVNSAEAFYEHLHANRVEAFTNYAMLQQAYNSFCAVEGLVPLGVTNLKRAMKAMGDVQRKSVRKDDGSYAKWYFFGYANSTPTDLVGLDNGLHVGLKVSEGAQREPEQGELGKDW